jgi:8-oxo-dGTP diphosphatase
MPQVLTSIKALIFNSEGKFLVLKERLRKKDIWDLPGGKIEYGETPKEALIREVKEELWIDVNVGKSAGIFWFTSDHHQYQVMCHTFICTPPKNFKLDFTHNPADEEFIDHKWVTPAEVAAEDFPGLTESFQKMIAELKL